MRAAPQRTPDLGVASLALVLAVSGVVFSGTARVFLDIDDRVATGVMRSLVYLGAGLLVMLLTMAVDYRRLTTRTAAWVLLLMMSAVLVAMLFAPEIANTHRFVRIGGVSVQPSEFAKPVLVLVLAATLAKAGDELRTAGGLARPLALGGLIAALVLAGRDLGTPALMFATTLALVTAAGACWRHTGALLAAGAMLFAVFTAIEDYRVQRVRDYVFGLSADPSVVTKAPKTLHQLKQSYIALGSGGIFGKGLGSSTQKAYFLPAPDNDFVFAVIGEELGLVTTSMIVGAFLLLAWRGHRIAEEARDEQGRYVALGATWMLVGQAFCHMAVVTGLLPTKGLPLPFLSTGGSSLIASFALVGLLLNVSLHGRDASPRLEVRRA